MWVIIRAQSDDTDGLMKKLTYYGIPILTIALFVLIMNSSFLFKHPGGIDVSTELNGIKQHINNANWPEAAAHTNCMKETVMKEIFPFVQFSVERDDMIHIEMDFSQLRGALEAKDKGLSLVYLQELMNDWDNLSK